MSAPDNLPPSGSTRDPDLSQQPQPVVKTETAPMATAPTVPVMGSLVNHGMSTPLEQSSRQSHMQSGNYFDHIKLDDDDAGPEAATGQVAGPSSSTATRNPPLPIDHRLTEPIDAFYKLQFLDPLDTLPEDPSTIRDGFSYYMQTLDVTIGRRVSGRDKGAGKSSRKLAAMDGSGSLAVEDKDKSANQDRAGSVVSASQGPQDSLPPEALEAKGGNVNPEDTTLSKVIVKVEDDVQQPMDLDPTDPADEASVQKEVKTETQSLSTPQRETGEQTVDGERQVDVDLGALKSVSRLHARIG